MRCRSVQRRCTVAGGSRALGEADRAHLSRCKVCADYVRGDESVRRLLAGLRAPEPGPGFEARLIGRIHAHASVGREASSARLAPWNRRLAYAAVAVVLVALGWHGWGYRGAGSSTVPAPITASADIEPERAPPPTESVPFPLEPLNSHDVFVFRPFRPPVPPSTGHEDRPPSRAQMILFEDSQP